MNGQRPAFATIALLAVAGNPCVAQVEPVDSFYVTPLVQAVRSDDARSVDDDSAFTLASGFRLSQRWNAELNLFRGRFDGTDADDLRMDAIGVNALRVFRRDARIAPYLLFGAGSQRKDRRMSHSSTDAYADAGIGLLTKLRSSEDSGRGLLLRAEVRTRYDDGDSRRDHMLGVGLQYAFGARSRGPVPARDTVPPSPGNDDRLVSPSAAEACASGTRMGPRGCEVEEAIRLPFVAFAFDSDRLDAMATAALDEAIATLRIHPDVHVEVAGHTDSIGSTPYNLALSQRRAEAVRRYLADNGIMNRLTVRGYGELEPVADNGTAAGRARNRRVVLRIISAEEERTADRAMPPSS